MSMVFQPLPLQTLSEPVAYVRPHQELSEHVHPNAPAIEVMTDLRQTLAITIAPGESIDDAMKLMRSSNIHLLLVENHEHQIIGLITSTDIQGEKPMRHIQEMGGTHADIEVRDIMIPVEAIEVIDLDVVHRAHIGDVVRTLVDAGRAHALVTQKSSEGDKPEIRGIFSTTQIGKQMGMPIEPDERTRTFSELSMAIAD